MARQALALDQYLGKEYFTYQCSVTTLTTTQQSATFTVDGDSDFFWTKTAAFALVADDGTVVSNEQLPGVSIVITNTSSGRAYMNTQTPIPNIAGSARLPFIMPIQTPFVAKSTIKVDFFNLTDNTTYSDLFLTFIGFKAYLPPGVA